jgi:hypothetical protein
MRAVAASIRFFKEAKFIDIKAPKLARFITLVILKSVQVSLATGYSGTPPITSENSLTSSNFCSRHNVPSVAKTRAYDGSNDTARHIKCLTGVSLMRGGIEEPEISINPTLIPQIAL